MMNVRQFRYSPDNLSYLVYGEKSAVAVDAGAVEEILSFVTSQGLTLTCVINTHSHYDHVAGNDEIIQRSGAAFMTFEELLDAGHIDIDGETLEIYHTPGHTLDSLSFKAGNILITGDTLFNGTVGNCFSGDMETFLKSIKLLMDFGEDTIIYGGHDYVKESMAFARTIDPDNPAIDRYLEKYDPGHIVSTLADELTANPFVRFNDESMIAIMKKRGLPVDTEFARWKSLMDLY